MDDFRLGLAVRARRHQRGWRLVDLAAAAGIGATTCSMLERGQASKLTVHTARAIAAAVDLPLGWDIGWQRRDIDRLLDADHAVLCAAWSTRLRAVGWEVRAEVSFNHYGDRGRIDLLAWRRDRRVVLVIEMKTVIRDVQDLLGALDVKARIAPLVAREIGWDPLRVVRAVFIAEGSSARRQVERFASLFDPFAVRGHAAVRWLREPSTPASGLLLFTKLPDHGVNDRRRAGRRRMRLRRARPRSIGSGEGASTLDSGAHSAG
jgi:transcriptional regulator with XRE-family HTH domain